MRPFAGHRSLWLLGYLLLNSMVLIDALLHPCRNDVPCLHIPKCGSGMATVKEFYVTTSSLPNDSPRYVHIVGDYSSDMTLYFLSLSIDRTPMSPSATPTRASTYMGMPPTMTYGAPLSIVMMIPLHRWFHF